MKKITGVIFTVCLAAIILGCATEKPATGAQGGMPQWVVDARRNAPEGMLVGVGSAKMATTNQSMTMSETRARASITRAMQSMVSDMVNDYTAANEVDPGVAVAFQEQVTRSLARANLSGTRVEEQNSDPTGTWWTVIYFPKTAANREMNQAQAAARLAVPAAIAFDAMDRMDNAFDKAQNSEWATFE